MDKNIIAKFNVLNELVSLLSSYLYLDDKTEDSYYRLKYENKEYILEYCFLNGRNEYTDVYIYSNTNIVLFRDVLNNMIHEAQIKFLKSY